MEILEVLKVIKYIKFYTIKASIMYGYCGDAIASGKSQLFDNCSIFPTKNKAKRPGSESRPG
jgi:hypothetical protein